MAPKPKGQDMNKKTKLLKRLHCFIHGHLPMSSIKEKPPKGYAAAMWKPKIYFHCNYCKQELRAKDYLLPKRI